MPRRTARWPTSRRRTSPRWCAWRSRRRFGDAAQDAGYKVYTTIDGRLQTAANRALRIGLVDYDRRHGWRGAINKVELAGNETPEALEALLDEYGSVGNSNPRSSSPSRRSRRRSTSRASAWPQIDWAGMSWAKRRVNDS